jgi:chemotaxis protein MotA
MDITTILGVVSGIGLIVMRPGGVGLKGFFNVSSLFITFGGAFAATLVNYPVKQVLGVFKIAKKVLTEKEEDPTELINQFINFTKIARKRGILELDEELNNVNSPVQ